MDTSDQNRLEVEIERLRQALDAETQRCVEIRGRLDRADAGFEEFVSMAAHNLREPLRDVASFSQLLTETYAGRFDADADMLLARIRDGAAGMQSLLADIVDYWASGTGDTPFTRTDMDAVLRQALLSTDQQIAQRRALVTHDPLPPVCGDFEVLAKVLHHLIRNAVQYCDKPCPRVHISSGPVNVDRQFLVRDNGPGIEPAFHTRIFEVFKRLHGRENPGNGLGLAFCKKAVEWHGGRMWMESTLGVGSTFCFTLPAVD
jgi:light-regulated signal transduction histidine kinase (bacteriophytochrome)